MGAQVVISQAQADDVFGLLKDVIAMVKNPDAIDEAYQRRADAAKLTDDEVAKAAEARALISQADALKADLQQQQEAITAGQADLEGKKAADILDLQAKTKKLSDWESQLNDLGLAHTNAQVANQVRAKELDERAAQIDSDNAIKQQAFDAQTLAQSSIDDAQKAEADRLATWRDQLKDKAAKLAALAQSDG